MSKLIKGLIIIALAAVILIACRPMKADAKTVKRYATQTVNLRKNHKTVYKVKRNTKLTVIKTGKKWSKVKYKGKTYRAKTRLLNAEKLPGKKRAKRYIKYLRTKGPVNWHGRKYTYYTSRMLPIWSLPVPGLHTDKNGFWCDKDDYIVLGSSRANKASRVVFATPFGKYGKVYDTGTASMPSWLCDTAVTW